MTCGDATRNSRPRWRRPDLWDDREKAETISRDKSALESELQIYDRLESAIDEAAVLLELANEADDAETRAEAAGKCDEIRDALEEIELHQLLGGDHDNSPVILSINSGAGGTDACDWAEMLMRMYPALVGAPRFQLQCVGRAGGRRGWDQECDHFDQWRVRLRLSQRRTRRASPGQDFPL